MQWTAEVDRIVDAWMHERPDLDFAPLQVLSRVWRISRHLDRARRNSFSTSDLESWEFDVLSALRRAGAPFQLSPKALLEETLVSSGTMTNRIDRLVERGLVERGPQVWRLGNVSARQRRQLAAARQFRRGAEFRNAR